MVPPPLYRNTCFSLFCPPAPIPTPHTAVHAPSPFLHPRCCTIWATQRSRSRALRQTSLWRGAVCRSSRCSSASATTTSSPSSPASCWKGIHTCRSSCTSSPPPPRFVRGGDEEFDVCDMEEFCRLESSEKTIAILGDRWWLQTPKQDGDRRIKQFLCNIWRSVMSAQMLEVSLSGGENGAPSEKGCVASGQMAKASNK